MANYTITAANVVLDTAISYTLDKERFAGVTLTAGQLVYKDAADADKLKLALAGSTAAIAAVYGVTLSGASAGQPCTVLRRGVYTVGATIALGTRGVLSATAGAICPELDLITNDYVSNVFEPISTTKAAVDFTKAYSNTGVKHV